MRRAVRFEHPEWIPMTFHINGACWAHYPDGALRELMAGHPLLFPGGGGDSSEKPVFSPVQRAGRPHRDPWGCLWETREDGITGSVTQHPLADWSRLEMYAPPDPDRTDGLVPVDWGQTARDLAAAKQHGEIESAGLRHGHTFMRLCDLRGYEKLMFDMADGEPRLGRLVDMVETFNLAVVRRLLGAGAEWMSYPEDLGMQQGPMIPPDLFRTHILPSYRRLMAPAREAGCIIHMHSDGDIRTLADDLLACGVDAINLQDRVNGLDWIAAHLAGRVCIDLDLDRQHTTRHGTPEEVGALVRDAVAKLGRREGGLTMIYGLYPGIPLSNVAALMDAMERYAGYYA
jgi:uroporphyrinogen decarboxylase